MVSVVDKTAFSIRKWQVIKTDFFQGSFLLELNVEKILHGMEFFSRARRIKDIMNKTPT